MVKGGFTLGFIPILKNYYNNGMIYDLLGTLPLNIILASQSYSYPDIVGISFLRLLRIFAI